MAHQSLYRKYRPSTFDDVVGQRHIERTLRNAVAEGTVAHAYLFTGPRGTGKTTTARLLAKALLCDRGPSAEPDGTCEQCIEIAEGRHPDVFELDAASRTGVDNVREEIIGRVQFAATRGRHKVYIIDEVHMLSTAAFNALLKTLEEPPSHVIFVLCTTHPHKVPDTIHSRCQRFDFHRISIDEIADRLRYIAESEGFRVDRGAFTLIARHADGGMRDAIATLELLAAYTGGEISVDDVEGIIGEVDSAQLFEVAGLVARRDIAGLFRWVAATAETGTDLAELVRELTGHVRDLFVIAAVGDPTGVVDRTGDEIAQLQAQSAEFGGPDRLARVLDLLGELAAEMRWSSDPRLSLEVALTRMARPQGELTLEAIAERVESLELGAPAVTTAAATAVAAPANPDRATSPTETQPDKADAVGAGGQTAREEAGETQDTTPDPLDAHAPAETAADDGAATLTPAVSGVLDRGTAKRSWQAVLIEVKKKRPARAQLFATVEVDVDPDDSTLVIEFPEDQAFSLQIAEEPEMRELLRASLARVLGSAPPFRFQLGRGAVRPAPAQEHSPTVDVEPQVSAEPQPDWVAQLGAQVVAEHPHEHEGEEEQ